MTNKCQNCKGELDQAAYSGDKLVNFYCSKCRVYYYFDKPIFYTSSRGTIHDLENEALEKESK